MTLAKPPLPVQEREKRAAEAMRKNLRKRKQQQQARASQGKETISLKDLPHDLEEG